MQLFAYLSCSARCSLGSEVITLLHLKWGGGLPEKFHMSEYKWTHSISKTGVLSWWLANERQANQHGGQSSHPDLILNKNVLSCWVPSAHSFHPCCLDDDWLSLGPTMAWSLARAEICSNHCTSREWRWKCFSPKLLGKLPPFPFSFLLEQGWPLAARV